MSAGVPVTPIVLRNTDVLGSRSTSMMKPGTVQVAVLPPVPVGDWTLPELSERIEEIRQQYVCVLATWPTTNEQLNLLLAGLAPAKGRPKTSLSSPGSRRVKDATPKAPVTRTKSKSHNL
jgi:putative phosphoserine phosphatase/1-acylglycerol-3-phosphate O-acyltransferase